jgi:glycerophosphoryl diester phosphodiesterase
MKPILKIGHRGAKGHMAENTLESIQKALEFGVDAIEIDVHRCKTGELVVFHDFTLDRNTNGSGEVAAHSLAELKELYVEEQYRIPTLPEVLDLIKGKCSINIELKGLSTAVPACKIIKDNVENNGWTYEEFLISSFQIHELQDVHDVNKKIPIGVLSKANMFEAIEFGKLIHAQAIHPSIGIITKDNVNFAHQAGFKVNAWTVNEPKDIERMKSFNVDGIISDYPERIGELKAV